MAFSVQGYCKQSPPVDVSKPYDPSTLRNKNILITGAANGLGAAMTRHWASHGASVLIGDLDDRAGEALVAELRTAHPAATFLYHHCDVTDWDSQVALFDHAVAHLPDRRIDIVVPNAGVLHGGSSLRFDSPQPDADGRLRRPSTKTFEVNITGVYFTTHLALHHLPATPGDRCLLLVGSLASLMAFSTVTSYCVSKHAVLGLFRAVRATAAINHNIRVNMICPYYVNGSNMMNKTIELTMLAGGAPGDTTAADVVDAATRLVADEGIRGRALAIGPRIFEVPVDDEGMLVEAGDVRLDITKEEAEGAGRSVWEVYADDCRRVDTWVWRYLGVLNTLTVARGYFRWFSDALTIWRRK